MRPAIDADGNAVDPAIYAALCARSHRVACRADLIFQGERVTTGLRVVGGDIKVNRRAAHRSTCTVTLAEPEMIPTLDDGTLRPDGHELQLWRGLIVPAVQPLVAQTDYLTLDGEMLTHGGEFLIWDPEIRTLYGVGRDEQLYLVPLGVFRIQTSTVDAETMRATIEGIDRSWPVSYARLEDVVVWDTSMTLEDAVTDLVVDALGDVSVDIEGVPHACPNVVHERGADRWQIILEAAAAVGYTAYFGGQGQFIWTPDPVLSDADPVGEIVDGEGGTLISMSVAQNIEQVYNRVIAVGSHPDLTAEYVGVSTDTDPFSPTRYDGPVNKKPRFYESQFINSTQSAVLAADAIQRDQIGIANSFEMAALVNATLEPGDAVLARCGRINVDAAVAIDDQVLPLEVERPMTLTVHPPLPIEEPV